MHDSPAAGFPLEGWEEKQGVRAAPDDLRPLLPAAERMNALLGRVRASSTLARSVHQPKRLVVTRLRCIRVPHWRSAGLAASQARYPDCRPRLLC